MNPKPVHGSIEILIVEDSPTQAEQLKHLLEKASYRVVLASNGNSALQSLKKHQPHVVISEIVIPVMDGYEICRRIKAEARFKEIPVILVTSLTDPRDVMRALAAGADSFIRKPYEERQLISMIQNVLTNNELRKEGDLGEGVAMRFSEHTYQVESGRFQALELLLSTYEAAVQQNADLVKASDALRKLNENLEQRVREKTMSLSSEIERRIAVEQAISDESRLLQTVLNAIPDAVYLKDASLRFVTCNAAFLKRLNASTTDEIAGKSNSDLFSPDIANKYYSIDRKVLGTGTPYEFDEEQSTAGGPIYVRSVRVPIRNESAAITGVLVIDRDITKHRQNEEELRNLARFPAENPEPVLRALLDGRLIYANEASSKLLESWGCRVGEMFPEPWLDRLRESAAADSVPIIEETSSGEIYSLNLVAVPEAGHVNIYGRDISNERLLEQQFLQAQKMEAVGRLAGGVAHDFNNMMTVVLGYSEALLRRDDLNTESKAFVQKIMDAGSRAAALTDQLLVFSRKRGAEPRLIDLNDSLRNIEKLLHQLIGDDIILEVLPSGQTETVLADPTQIDQILMNLAANARDAMPDGGTFILQTESVDLDEDYAAQHDTVKPGRYVLLSVSDTGIGMDAYTQKKVFEPFFTTKGEGKGTGLGLSTVYGIVKQANGHIWIYSEPGRGTTFKIYLPAADGSTPLMDAKVEPPIETCRGVETILIVEDEVLIRDFAKNTLSEFGYSAIAAVASTDAEDIVRSTGSAVDLVLIDVVMPNISGPALGELLASSSPEIKIIYMSGYTGHGVASQGTLEKQNDFLPKPFSREQLVRKVREVLDRHASQE